MIGIPTLLSSLSLLKWPMTIAGAAMFVGLSTDGTLSLVTSNGGRPREQSGVSNDINMPPVKQSGDLDPYIKQLEDLNPYIVSSTPPRRAHRDSIDAAIAVATPLTPSVDLATQSAALAAPTPEPPDATAGRIGQSAANLRAGASKSSATLSVLAAGTQIRLGETSGNWVHVAYDGGQGWVYSGLLENPKAAAAHVTVYGGAEKRGAATRGKLVQAGSEIVVRDAPNSSADTTFKLEVGERVRVIQKDGKWSRIVTASGETGWIRVK